MDLSKNNFEGHAVEQLAQGLQVLSFTCFTSTKVHILTQGLQGCSDLTALSLASNNLFGPPGAKFLGQVLSLRCFTSFTSFASTKAQMLTPGLQILRRNTLLVSLDLSNAELFPEVLLALLALLVQTLWHRRAHSIV